MNYDHYNAEDLTYHHQLDKFFYQSEDTFSLDKYQETGVYVEEDRENGDLLIVLGETVLENGIRQFYISEDNHAYTRGYWQNAWDVWFKVPLAIASSPVLDLNQLCSSTFLLINQVKTLQNAPLELFQENSQKDIIICMKAPNYEHLIQFLIGDNRKKFWIRHHDGQQWSDWSTFM